jgi:hypothetical protein
MDYNDARCWHRLVVDKTTQSPRARGPGSRETSYSHATGPGQHRDPIATYYININDNVFALVILRPVTET